MATWYLKMHLMHFEECYKNQPEVSAQNVFLLGFTVGPA